MLVEVDAMGFLVRDRDEALVLIAVESTDEGPGAIEQLPATVSGLVDHTPRAIPIVLLAGPRQLERIEADGAFAAIDRELFTLPCATHLTPAQALADALLAAAPSDVVLLVPGVFVAKEWLAMLKAAAMSDTAVASATPLSLGPGGVEVATSAAGTMALCAPGVPAEWVSRHRCSVGFDELAADVRRRSLRVWPRLMASGPYCSYIRRTALDTVGTLAWNLKLEPALAEFAMRAAAVGMVHVVADNVLVDTRLAGDREDAQATHSTHGVGDMAQMARETIERDERSPLRRSLAVARRTFAPVSVTIDGRALVSAYGGTQTYLLGLITAIARSGHTRVRVLTPPDLSKEAQRLLEGVADVALVSYEQMVNGAGSTEVVHRPQQVFTADDLSLLRLAGKRLVIGQQDLIAYHNWSYHADLDRWQAYRRVTRISLAIADQVVFFSEHARNDALAEDLVSEKRAHVIGIGPSEKVDGEERQPAGLDTEQPFMLCLGADYAHKNRPFAIELQCALQELGWGGRLVFAGAHVEFGSSAQRERELLDCNDELATCVVDVGTVDELERRWLLRRARALVYPTIYEGFGLIPAEAAVWNLPCLFAAHTSLAELALAATLVPWDAAASAVATVGLLHDGEQRRAHLAVLASLSQPSWDSIAEKLAMVYEHAISCPSSAAAPGGWQELERERVITTFEQEKNELAAIAQEYQDAYHRFEQRVAHALPLIDEGGLLSRAQQRGLMRVAARRRVGGMLLAPLGLLGRCTTAPVAVDEDRADC